MTSASQLLNVAKGELGVKENPPESNDVKYTRWYPMVGEPWCAMFTSWCVDQVHGLGTLMVKHAYTPDGVSWFKSKGLWHSSPKPGDVVFYEWPDMGRVSHTGFVENVYSDGAIDAIEGNTDEAGGRTGGKVMRQHRTAYMVGYGRPPYDSSSGGGGADDMQYFCEVAQNTGQAVSPAGEDIRMQVENSDDMHWHSDNESWPSIAVDRRVRGLASATIYVEGPCLAMLRTYSSENVKMKTVAAQRLDATGYVNLSGYAVMSPGHKLRLFIDPFGSVEVSARYGVLSLGAQDA